MVPSTQLLSRRHFLNNNSLQISLVLLHHKTGTNSPSQHPAEHLRFTASHRKETRLDVKFTKTTCRAPHTSSTILRSLQNVKAHQRLTRSTTLAMWKLNVCLGWKLQLSSNTIPQSRRTDLRALSNPMQVLPVGANSLGTVSI